MPTLSGMISKCTHFLKDFRKCVHFGNGEGIDHSPAMVQKDKEKGESNPEKTILWVSEDAEASLEMNF